MPDHPPTPRYGLLVVRGRSMVPALREGDRLLLDYRRRPRVGAVVLARLPDPRLPDGRLVVKRVAGRRDGGWWLLSDNAAGGTDSRQRGAVPDHDVVATALLRVWPRPGRLPGRLPGRRPGRD